MGRPADVRTADETLRRRQTVLLVDDEPDILESLKDILEAADPAIRVTAVGSAVEGLEVLAQRKVCLIVSDYKMPGMDGLDFLAEARHAAPGTPSVLITAFPDLDVALKAINQAGVDHFLTKPFSPGAVIAVVRELLSEHRSRELRNSSFERALALVQQARSGRARSGAGPGPLDAPARS